MKVSVVVVAVVASVVSGVLVVGIWSGSMQEPRDIGYVDDTDPMESDLPLPYGPVVVDNTARLFNLTNNSDSDQKVTASVVSEGELPAFWFVWVTLMPEGGSSWDWQGFGMGYDGSPDRGVIGIDYQGVTYEAPVGLYDVSDGYEESGELEVPPGDHHLFVSAQNVDIEFTLETEEREPSITLRLAHEDPGMFRLLFAHVEGHWDEVHEEIWSPRVGMVHASTRMEVQHSIRAVGVFGYGDHNEFRVVDADGHECRSEGVVWTNLPSGIMVVILPKGEFFIEGKTTSITGFPYLGTNVWDLPIEPDQPEEFRCWTHEGHDPELFLFADMQIPRFSLF